MSVRILFIEDDQVITSFVIKGLKEAGFVVDHAPDGEEGLHKALTDTYDMAIVDLMLPKLDGLSLISQVRQEKPTIPIMILSAKRSVDDRVKGLETGSDDYLTKPFSFSELLARINALMRRVTGTPSPTKFIVADLSLDLLSRDVVRAGNKIDLQPKEFSLLEYLMRNSGRAVTKTMIMEHVWDLNFDPQTNIVEVRISKLRDKIDKDYEKKLLHTIRGAGYILKETA
jgi:two-component system, OmpR family, response regulator